MDKKVGRNDPCPCGSGKKYKQCCMKENKGPRKFKAKLISGGGTKKQMPNLMDRTFGNAIRQAEEGGQPPKPIEPPPAKETT